MLKAQGLLKDSEGNNRTLYSLRHTYAANRILDGDVDHYLLSKAMGCTVRVIEQHYGRLEPKQKAVQLTRSKRQEQLTEAWRLYDKKKRAKESRRNAMYETEMLGE